MKYFTSSKLNNHSKTIFIILALVIFGIFITKYFQKHGALPASPPGVPVVVLKTKLQDLPITFSYPARVSGYRNVAVLSQVEGILKEILYNPGQMIVEGSNLFQIDPVIYLETLKNAEGKLQQAKSNLWQTERSFERAKRLYKVKAISLEELDIITANLQIAQSAVVQAQAGVMKAQTNLSYTLVKAPISGMISKEIQSVGSLISSRPDGNLLTYIVQTDPAYINFSFPTADYTKRQELIKRGKLFVGDDEKLKVAVRLDNFMYNIKGKLSFIDNFIDLKTQSILARAELKNPNNKLIPGAFVTAVVEGFNYKNIALVPDQAVIQTKDGPFLYVVTGERATMKKVELGEIANSNRIILHGLEDGDLVITEGMIKVRPHSEVKISKVVSQ